MQTNDSAALEYAVTDDSIDLQKRDVSALTEYMTVLSLGGEVYSVTTESGSEYRVDVLKGRCTCPDKQYNLEDSELCKHERRVRFATGEWTIPGWADTDAVDSQLGEHVTGSPQIATTDGGLMEDTVDREGEKQRPDDCLCGDGNQRSELPCWPCYRNNFKNPNREGGVNE
ncbi:hypothetical protein [Halovenus marina]|uniref:hypothetical protein n=1 Tax=Halovenus marina TaxID=3396621 RepID=UPI003F54A709